MNIRSNNGYIAAYVLVAMIVFTAFAVGAFVISANKEQSQLEITEQLQRMYANGQTAAEAYAEYTNQSDIIPVYDAQQLGKMGSGETVYINGKSYIFSTGKTYVLQNNITFEGDFSAVQTLIDNNSITLEKQGYEYSIINE